MKSFFAVEIPISVSQQIIQQTAQLRKDYPNFDWVPSENFHITLFYAGEIPKEKLDIVDEHVQRAIFDIEPTYVYTLGAGIFIQKSISIFIDLRRNKTLELIHERLVTLFEDKQREYKPHITIAKWKIPSKQQYFHLKKKLQNLPIEIEFPVKEIHLYESISKQKHPIYNKIHSFVLEE